MKQPAGKQQQIVSPEFSKTPNETRSPVPTVDTAQQTEGKSRASLQSRVRAFNGWILPVTINGVVTGALIYSGASTSVLSKSIYLAMTKDHRANLQPDNIRLKGVGNHIMIPLGRMEVEIGVSGNVYPLEMVVSSADETAGCYLGLDFFDAYG